MYQYQVSFGEAISRGFKNYCNFTGRASRSEYWWWYLFTVIVSWILGGPYIFTTFQNMVGGIMDTSFSFWSLLADCWVIFIFLPSFGLLFRRLHDTGRSGWWWLLGFIPLIGTIILIIWLCQASQPGDNRYGAEPNIRY